jgi:hypothetical protein
MVKFHELRKPEKLLGETDAKAKETRNKYADCSICHPEYNWVISYKDDILSLLLRAPNVLCLKASGADQLIPAGPVEMVVCPHLADATSGTALCQLWCQIQTYKGSECVVCPAIYESDPERDLLCSLYVELEQLTASSSQSGEAKCRLHRKLPMDSILNNVVPTEVRGLFLLSMPNMGSDRYGNLIYIIFVRDGADLKNKRICPEGSYGLFLTWAQRYVNRQTLTTFYILHLTLTQFIIISIHTRYLRVLHR